MVEAQRKRASLRRWLTHVVALSAGVAVATFFGNRALRTADDMGAMFSGEPLAHATSFAYAWGSDADAAALLRRYANRLRTASKADPFAGPGELALSEFRCAIVEHRSHAELVELCRATPRCNVEKLDALVSKLSAGRRVIESP
jgi:hypothetical protein